MRKLLFFALLITLFAGCQKNCCTNISSVALIKYVNPAGEDLLDPSHPSAILEQDVDVFVEKNGTKVMLNNSMMDSPENFKIYKSASDGYVFKFLFPIDQAAADKNKVTVYIRYKDQSEDKLVGEFNSLKGSNIILQRVWINGIDKGTPTYLESRAYLITK